MSNTAHSSLKFFEDFSPGMTFRSHEIEVDTEQIVRFAGEFDPQPFHVDADAAASSFFGGLVASGWHTAALTMRLLLASDLAIAGGLIGAGGEIKWPAAMRPGDCIHVEVDVVATRLLRSRADLGMITTRSRTLTREGSVVQEFVANLVVPRRETASEPAPAVSE